MSKIIIIVLLGPGERELKRFSYLLGSLCHFEKEVVANSTLIIVDDGSESEGRKRIEDQCGFKKVIVVDNPFAVYGRTALVYDRLMAGIISGMREVGSLEPHDFVLKVDTDAVVCAPFTAKIQRYFANNPMVGMVGSLRHDPDGRVRDTEAWWSKIIRGTCGLLPSKVVRFHLKYKIPFRGVLTVRRWFSRYQIVNAAIRAKWTCGESILGGAYAISPAAVDGLVRNSNFLVDPMLFEGTRISEDVGMSMLTAAAGFRLGEYNRKGEVFGVWYQKPTLSAGQLIEAGYGLIHSVKDDDQNTESKLRRDILEAAGMPI